MQRVPKEAMRYKSIIQEDLSYCFICGSRRNLELHHVFNASNKKNSEKYGMLVRLCHNHHNEKPYGAHHNIETRRYLQQKGQKAFEEAYPDLDFLSIFGRNYI